MRYLFNNPNSSEASLSASATNTLPEDTIQEQIKRNKQLVASQFSRASQSYDGAARIQQYAALQLCRQIPQVSGHWLDLGSGTGYAVKPLLKQGAQRITGLDLAAGMVTLSQQKLQHKPFYGIVGDAENLPFANHCFDGIYSNLMIQWSEYPQQLFSEARRVLKPGSLFAFTTLGPRTMHELKAAWQQVDPYVHVNQFQSKQTILSEFQQHFDLLQVRQQEYVQMHHDLKSLLKELKAIGATNVNAGRRPGLGGRERLRKLDCAYRSQSDCCQLALTYDLIWVIGQVR